MKLKIPLIFFFLFSIKLCAQTNVDSTEVIRQDQIISIVEVSAEFPGGVEEFMNFLSSNLKYSKDARKAKAEGKVLVEFVIERDGHISAENVKVIKGIHKSLDAEAIRVVRLSPRWTPGTQHGIPVRVKQFVPINFSL